MPDIKTDKGHRKLGSQQQFRENRQELTDPADIFSLPKYIRIMVSNYQPLQAIFAGKEECHKGEIRKDEQFSSIVTIVDTATQQPLDCVLLLHGDKPLEVKYRTLFCYIAIQVQVDQYQYDTRGSHLLYQVKSKPYKQNKLLLSFCFHQPGAVFVIQLSIHSIVDSEGVEYMYNSEDCDCIVQIIDRNQHGEVKTRDRHGVVRMKEPPRLRYTGPLATKKYHMLERQFTKLYLSPDYEQVQLLAKLVKDSSSISADIKVFALCWEALSVAVHKNYEHAEELLKTAWEKASQLDCQNGLLLQGRVLRHLAHMQYNQGKDDKALEYISGAKERFSNAVPSNETAFALHTELRIKRRALFNHTPFPSELYTSIENDYELFFGYENYVEEYEQPVTCNFFVMKASLHLRSELITDQLPPEVRWPSPDDLRKAEECLNRVSLDIMPNQINFYTARYFCTLCELYIWKKQYSKAVYYLEEARKVHHQVQLNARMQQLVDQRLKLLAKLEGDDRIGETLKEY